MEKAIAALNAADKEIKGRHRYACGLERPAEWLRGDRVRVFFQSPDGQNGELYYALQKHGFSHSMHNTEYHWRVLDRKTGYCIAYTEGDLDIYKPNPMV